MNELINDIPNDGKAYHKKRYGIDQWFTHEGFNEHLKMLEEIEIFQREQESKLLYGDNDNTK